MRVAATIKDVARHAGLSIATISKYINGGHVLDVNRLLIDRAVEELGFKVNGMARSLKTSKTMTVGVLIPDLESIFCTSIVSNVENVLQDAGYSTLICDYRQDPDMERRKLSFLADRQIDGLLMLPLGNDPGLLEPLRALNIPCVLIDRPVRGAECDTILVDNLNASYAAVEHLVIQGHRRIGIIRGPKAIHTAEERYTGYARVHADYNLPIERALVRDGGYSMEGGYYQVNALLEMDVPPTALFVTNYEMTLGAIMALNERNVRIPEELSFIGFDNHSLTRLVKPLLSIVVQPIRQIGEMAAQTLLRRMRGDRAGFPLLCRMKTELLLQASVAPAQEQGGSGTKQNRNKAAQD